MTDDEKISMTSAELAAFVDARIAEDRASAGRTAKPIVPITPITPEREPMSAELEALFGKALDLAEGNANKATQTLLGWVDVDINGRPIDASARALFMDWYWIREAASVYWRDIVRNVMANIQRKRDREKASV